jgi:hypothetical protein
VSKYRIRKVTYDDKVWYKLQKRFLLIFWQTYANWNEFSIHTGVYWKSFSSYNDALKAAEKDRTSPPKPKWSEKTVGKI